MPAEIATAMSNDPAMQAVAATMPYDFAVIGNISRGGTIPEDRVRAVAIPTLVVSGGTSPDFFRDTAERITKLLTHGTHTVLDGHDHAAPPDVVAPVVADFLTQGPLGPLER
jgi:pimeloyl-ACP methyl ester carboxylesterase